MTTFGESKFLRLGQVRNGCGGTFIRKDDESISPILTFISNVKTGCCAEAEADEKVND